ncbi:MAG: NAD(P)-dependent glycerol-3-phosphate dehydrogenase [Candidatus Tectomicrobia bacterium]|uniref:Glycerol-3-phosphate dehydrogenase [NAD(P)+] n=1 Tax=Tectimicrobiota bacterium TaxID=2528274 RepID=A0A937W1J9_UNCTE|nr:NAD(P)-dependent glycerol-3-phosphate dehydrogenase [Candidatus Tectomicrobia bacterium]
MTDDHSLTRVAVIGAGSWGTALAHLLASKGHEVLLWARSPALAQRLRLERTNAAYLPGVPLHTRITPTADFNTIAQATHTFVSVVPSHAVRTVWGMLSPNLPGHALLISATKGIEAGSLHTMSQVLQTTLVSKPSMDIAVLSGPTFAREVLQGTPTVAVVAAAREAVAAAVQQLFSTATFRVYTNTDVLGVELGGALKNVMAIAAGVCDGLQLGYNTRAALITRGLAEMTSLGIAMGARPLTFAGLSGMGDLVLTCTGPLSRNYAVGVQLGQGKKLPDILAQMHMVAEGVTTASAAVALGEQYHVEMPIAAKVYALLQGHITPHEAVAALMQRTLKHEDR